MSAQVFGKDLDALLPPAQAEVAAVMERAANGVKWWERQQHKGRRTVFTWDADTGIQVRSAWLL